MMGGRVSVHILDTGDPSGLAAAATRVLDRMECWAARLTRFSPASELSRLNAALAGGSGWARRWRQCSTGGAWRRGSRTASWTSRCSTHDSRRRLRRAWGARRRTCRSRPTVAGRWSAAPAIACAARARRSLRPRRRRQGMARRPRARARPGRSALVDADGDIPSVRRARRQLGDRDRGPARSAARLAVLELGVSAADPASWGVATSGTSVHRWQHGTVASHHLIDPRTGRSAATDVVQATAVASTAREAEARAKAAVILGSGRCVRARRAGRLGGLLLLTEGGEVVATPGMMRWLA